MPQTYELKIEGNNVEEDGKELLIVNGQVQQKNTRILIGSRASNMFISRKWVEKNQLPTHPKSHPTKVELPEGQIENVTKEAIVELSLEKLKAKETMQIVTLGRYDAVLGMC